MATHSRQGSLDPGARRGNSRPKSAGARPGHAGARHGAAPREGARHAGVSREGAPSPRKGNPRAKRTLDPAVIPPGSVEQYKKRPSTHKAPQHISHVTPSPDSATWESDEAYEKRVRRGSYVEEKVKRRHRKIGGVAIAVIAAAVAVALAVGAYVFFKSTDSKLSLADESVQASLAAAEKDAPYYVLCTADLRDRSYATHQPEDLAYMLVRVDEAGRTLTFVTIPSVLEIEFPDGEFRTLEEAADTQSDGDIIKAIGSFAGVDISHFITTDALAIYSMVELVGGVEVDVPQEADDPRAGHVVVDAGKQVLDGQQALVFIRATNLQGGFETTAENRAAFTRALLAKALGAEGLGLANVVSDASTYIDTDFTTSDLLSRGELLRPFDDVTVLECSTPYTTTRSVRDDSVVNSLSKAEWSSMMESVRQTGDPGATGSAAASSVDESEVTVEVRNGTSINGAAASLANMLAQLGYQIIGTGNTGDGITYPETLVVYTDAAYEDAAKAIVREVGIGRVVNGGDFYSSEAGIIAIVGADWAK